MIIVILIILGLSLGSFVNALVWRLHEQLALRKGAKGKQGTSKLKLSPKQLSIISGRSVCVHCGHELSAKDLIPVLSWLSVSGKCRYCHKPISKQYPVVELATAALFVASYVWWPQDWGTGAYINFAGWLLALVALMALVVYDIRWMLLPNRIVYPLIVGSGLLWVSNIIFFDGGLHLLWYGLLSAAIAGGIFCLLFFISDGKWIGGGDVKIGFALGFLLMDPYNAFLMLFTASVIGMLVSLPGLVSKKITATSRIPFGPFLIIATVIVKLFGASVIAWYKRAFLTL
jgi:prepilin signal peptidase PulO-like enzyme (type II secretory pathway)